jgi:hypothetical protein
VNEQLHGFGGFDNNSVEILWDEKAVANLNMWDQNLAAGLFSAIKEMQSNLSMKGEFDIEKLDLYSEENDFKKLKIDEKYYALPINNYQIRVRSTGYQLSIKSDLTF